MIRLELRRDGAGTVSFGIVGFAKNNRECIGTNAAAAENSYERAGVDPTGEKDSDWHVADQLHAHRLVERGSDHCLGSL